jgi:hypothetical protein
MKVPNAHSALVRREKITEYLLKASHPDNKGKAQFFASLGFDAVGWDIFAQALRKHARVADVVNHLETVHGIKYVLNGFIETPSARHRW